MTKDDELLKKEVENIRNNLKEYYQNKMDDEENKNIEEYIYDALDIKHVLNSDKTFHGVHILVALGGPNIWIDTTNCSVRGYWGGSQHTCYFDGEIAEYIDSYFEYIF